MPRKTQLKGTAKVAPAATATPVEPKQAVIPDGRGVIPVQGYEGQVKEFKTNLRFWEQLGKQVEAAKSFFRNLTEQVLEKVSGEVARVTGTARPINILRQLNGLVTYDQVKIAVACIENAE